MEWWAFSEHLLCAGRGAGLLARVSPRASPPPGGHGPDLLSRKQAGRWSQGSSEVAERPLCPGGPQSPRCRRPRWPLSRAWAPSLLPATVPTSAPFHVLSRLFAASCASYNFSFLSPQGLSFASQGSSAPFWSGTSALGAWGGRPAASCLAGLARGCPLAHSPCLKVSTAACSLVPAGVEGSGPGKEVARTAGGAAAGT